MRLVFVAPDGTAGGVGGGGPAPNTAWALGVRFSEPLGPRRGKAARTNKHRGGVARPSFRATRGPVGL